MFAGPDIVNEYQSGQSLIPAVKTATENGSAVDFRDCGPEVFSVVTLGAASGTGPTCIVSLEESADNSTWTAISGFAHTTLTDTSDNSLEVKSAIRTKRYVRQVATIAGTTPSYAVAGALIGKKVSY